MEVEGRKQVYCITINLTRGILTFVSHVGLTGGSYDMYTDA